MIRRIALAVLILSAHCAAAGIALVGHTTGGYPTFVSGTLNTTGATLLVVTVGDQNADTTTLADHLGNSFTCLTAATGGVGFQLAKICYSYPTSVGAGDFITVSGGTQPQFSFSAWSGTSATSIDASNEATSGGGGLTSWPPGSITPTVNNELVVTVAGLGSAASGVTAPSGYTSLDFLYYNGGAFTGYAMFAAYEIQTSATATNPTFAFPANAGASSAVASFKPVFVAPTFVANSSVIVIQ